MSQQGVTALVERFTTDEQFREQAIANPGEALSGFDLTESERGALLSGDADQLRGAGIDEDSLMIFMFL
ncbi:MAG: Os1348 family NHLP clan protein [Acidimicrobiia bacterium]